MVACWDDNYNKVIAVEEIIFGRAQHPNAWVAEVEAIRMKSVCLPFQYKAVSLAILNNKSTLIPLGLYDPQVIASYLAFNHKIGPEETIHEDHLNVVQAKNSYTVPKNIEAYFRGLYQPLQVMHFSSGLIEQILLSKRNQTGAFVSANIRIGNAEIVVVENGKLLFYNSFVIQTPEDFLFYLLYLLEQLKLNPENIAVELMGNIDEQHPIHQLVYKYIRHVSFAKNIESLGISHNIARQPNHRYYTLFSQLLYAK